MEIECQQLLKINYANIQDKTQLENIIVEHKATIEHLIKQIHQLTNIHQQEQLQRHIVLNKMQQNMLENTTQMIRFKNSINQITDDHTKQTKDHQEEKEKHRKTADLAHLNELNQLHKQLEELQTQYRQLSQSEEKETNYLKQIHKLNEDLISKQYDHHDTMNQQQKKQVKENMHLNAEAQAKLQEVKKNIYHVAKNQVTEDNQASQLKNNQLRARLLTLQNELAALKKTSNQLLQQRKELKINLTLNEEELEEYKAVGSLQKAKIKVNKDKLQNLKRVVAEEVAKRQKTIAQIRNSRTEHNKALKATLNQLNNRQQQMRLNLEKMKLLAQTILLQRQEVQQFFIMALQQCKKDIEAETQGGSGQQKTYSDKVDIEQLSPKDRQRILTNLYTKLALGP